MKQPKFFRFTVPAAAAAAVLTAFGCALVYKFSPHLLPVSGDAAALPGDANVDSRITVSDAVMLARYCAEDTSCGITEEGLANSDLNHDRIVTIDDCTVLLYQLAHLTFTPDGKPVSSTAPAVTSAESTATSAAASIRNTASAQVTVSAAVTETVRTTVTTTETEPVTTTSTTETTTTSTPETTTTEETTTTRITTTSEETTTTTKATTPPPVSVSASMRVDGRSYPLDVPLSVLTEQSAPDEILSLKYEKAAMQFAVFTQKPEQLVIAIAENGNIAGYYAIGKAFSVPDGYSATDYIDKHPDGTNKTYAQLILRKKSTIAFASVANKNDLSVLAKLNYYAVNGIRAVNGLYALKWDQTAAGTAYAHSADMASKNYFSHTSLDGTEFSDRLSNAGVDWKGCGENINCGYTDPFAALNGWYNSQSGHRESMLSEVYTNLGVGFAYGAGSKYRFYGTQDYYAGWD